MGSNADFIRMIKPGCFSVYKRINILPSIAAAQAILESNWGRSSLATKAHNYFGIKGSSSVPSVQFMTKEFINGRMVSVPQYFQKFDSFLHCVEQGYIVRVLGRDRYRKARGVRDPRTAITIIKQAGYATDPNYVNLIMSVINSNNLDQWDKEAIAGGNGGNMGVDEGGFGGGTTPVELDGKQFYTFNNDFIKKNNYTRPGLKLSGVAAIVLHDAGTPGLTASTIRSTLDKGNGGKKNGYHILIDKKDTVSVVPLDEVVYHTDTKGLQVDFLKKSTSYYPSGNADLTTISIGLCSERNGTFDDATVARAIAVCAELINHYALPMEVILRGFDIDGSLEPLPFYNNYFDYTVFLGLVEYQKNQNTPLMNEDLQALYDQRDNADSSAGSSAGELISATSGSRKKLLELAFKMESWGMSYSQAKRYQIRQGGYADCSSFTQYVYKNTLNIDPGITTKFQIRNGKPVARKNAKPGDLVFWCPPGRDPSIPGNVSHVGMVIDDGAKYCIHTSYSAGAGRTIQRLFIDSMSLTFMQIRTYVKEEGESTSSPATPEVGGSIGDIDLTKKYVIEIKASINSYNSDSDIGTSVKRVAKGTILNVLSIGGYGFRIGQDEWIRKKDSASFEMRAKGKADDPVGAAVVIGVAPAKTAPSIVSANVLEQGKAKTYEVSTTLPVYGIQNSMLLVTPASSSKRVYIPQLSTEYTSYMNDYPIYTDRTDNDDSYTPMSPKTAIKVRAKLITDSVDPETGRFITGGTVSVKTSLFPIGSTISISVPSMPSYNGRYLVVSNHDDAEDLVYFYTTDNSDVVLLGTRAATGQID